MAYADATGEFSTTPQLVPDLDDAIALSTTSYCVSRARGSLRCWGMRPDVAVGADTIYDVAAPPARKLDWNVNYLDGCLVSLEGTVWCAVDIGPFVQVGGLRDVVEVSTFGLGSCAITTAHRRVCWGPRDPQEDDLIDRGPADALAVSFGGSRGCHATSGQVTCHVIGPTPPQRVPDPQPTPEWDMTVVGMGAVWSFADVAYDYAGPDCALTVDDRIACWDAHQPPVDGTVTATVREVG
jgi:hypothetical protein